MRPPAEREAHIAFIDDPWVLRMLELSGWRPRRGLAFTPSTINGVWGQQRWSRPGRFLSRLTGAGVLTIEDGFLRSIHTGRMGDRPFSITLDEEGVYFDASAPSRLERIIQSGEGLGPEVVARARAGIERLQRLGLSKYSPVPRGAGEVPEPGYILVIDQTEGDASISGGAASGASFAAMLDAARAENPGERIVVRTHPEVLAGRRRGHFYAADLRPGEILSGAPANPWDLIDGAKRVYAVTSQMGFEAAVAGREVHVFGLPFYAGWGFTRDRLSCPRRTARRSAEEVFAASHLLFPVYYDPFADQLTDFEGAADLLAAQARWRQVEPQWRGEVYAGFSRWKRRHLLRYGPARREPPRFLDDLAQAATQARDSGSRLLVAASRFGPGEIAHAREACPSLCLVEDGFLRSVGLGAALVEAGSLVFDEVGIYFDPARPSRLEQLIAEAAAFPADDVRLRRAAALRERIVSARVTKYNVGAADVPTPPAGRRVLLVPGQVEDDASIRCGAGEVRTNLALLERARAANPDAYLVFKPHPDVEAGLRLGGVDEAEALRLADHVAHGVSADALIAIADEIWTMTSLMGFEALLRGKEVTTLGVPFYAGWGLTRDIGEPPSRRCARPSLDALVWAALIAYPSYVDPVAGLPCEVETAVARLVAGAPL
ncbi:capsular polysaccharide biosynthesis protein [Limibaculum sp. M0105]|uniref:Capsular polysaccharide biosynthesis protein n=1 Tax=Thermohalobaculum xanthum TaxID=2753746 RepID=A0A8J7M924_9RHOB|nr:capsular polysaccharide biosynthesis protein [Thermohalobaculum xanthum]MBK0399978.1 capsular polysaccharide biosynthesis protein [Thermohalobaculum xanthum]